MSSSRPFNPAVGYIGICPAMVSPIEYFYVSFKPSYCPGVTRIDCADPVGSEDDVVSSRQDSAHILSSLVFVS